MGGNFTSAGLDAFFRGVLDIAGWAGADDSLNGIQVGCDAPVGKIAFAVDASLETIGRAADCGAGMLFVHHGLFWGRPAAIDGNLRRRVKALLDAGICLYAAHLPLDAHPELGNNAALAGLLGLTALEPFGECHGRKIGFKGRFAEPVGIDEAARRIAFEGRPPLGVFPFGKEGSETCAVVSGGAARSALEAVGEGIDLFVTGEMGHSYYADCLEGGLNVIAGGHYSTEVWGLRSLMRLAAAELNVDTVFLDVPTGL